MLIAPTDTKAMYAPIKQLADGGSKIVLVDTTLEHPTWPCRRSPPTTRTAAARRRKALAELIGGKGKVFVVNVKPGISTTDARAKGFEEGAKEAGLDYLGQEYDNDEPAKAAAIVKAQLAKNPDLKGIFATNLFSAEGAASGLREAGKAATVKIVGFDAGPEAGRGPRGRRVQALSPRSRPTSARRASSRRVNALDGKPAKPEIGTEFTITKDNLAENQDALYKSSC